MSMLRRAAALHARRAHAVLTTASGRLLGHGNAPWRASIVPPHSAGGAIRPLATAAASIGRGKDRTPLELAVGDKVHGYTVDHVEEVAALNITSYVLTHERTGTRHMHVDSADTNNTFTVAFHTPPKASDGAPHVLEHTVLCGSERYPVRDPFFNMLKRSLNTFMNAQTGSDCTLYPFSTQNESDFRNLLSVYCDAAFFPNLRRVDFLQEGHRLEFHEADKPESGLTRKGVVYNEMKGAMADGNSRYMHTVMENVLAGTPYAFNSGGEPSVIPELTWEALRGFHAEHYHPTNACFFTYGDLSPLPHLQFIDEHVLARFERHPNPPLASTVAPTPGAVARVERAMPVDPVGEPDAQHKVGIAMPCGTVTDVYETFSMRILSDLLLDGPSAPMYKALIESQLGTQYTPGTGFDAHTRHSYFSVGVQGVHKDNVRRAEEVIEETLVRVSEDGFPDERVAAITHQLELFQKHVTSNFGLQLAGGITPFWLNGGDPVSSLRFQEHMDRLKRDMEEGPYLQNLIRRHLLPRAGQHRVTVHMVPDARLVEQEAEAEAAALKRVEAALSGDDVARIVREAGELAVEQGREQDVDCLPTLGVDDIPRENPTAWQLEHTTLRGAPLAWSEQPTNGLVYARFKAPVKHLAQPLQINLPLFAQAVKNVGAAELSYEELALQEELLTGGIGVSTLCAVDTHNVEEYNCDLHLRTHFLTRNTDAAMELVQRIITAPHLDQDERIRIIIGEAASAMVNSIHHNGHRFAMLSAASDLSPGSAHSELLSGISQVRHMMQLCELDSDGIKHAVVPALQRIAEHVLQPARMSAMINCEAETRGDVLPALAGLLGADEAPPAPHAHDDAAVFHRQYRRRFFTLPSQVNYVAQAFPTVAYTHPDHPALRLFASVTTSNFLHQEIREKGGAYGGGCAQTTEGACTFYSYRDPRSIDTLSSFAAAIHRAQAGHFTDKDITEAKLSLFQSLDMPTPPGSMGTLEFVHGIDPAVKGEYRDRLRAVTRADVVRVAEEYFADTENSSIAVLGGAPADDVEAHLRRERFEIMPLSNEASA